MPNIVPIHHGIVQNGQLKILDRDRMTEWIKSLNGPVTVVIRSRHKPRSDRENRYYRGVVIKMIADYVGDNPDDVHFAMRMKFLKPAGALEIPMSSTKLSTIEFEEYLENIRRWAGEFLGLLIPLPNEVIT